MKSALSVGLRQWQAYKSFLVIRMWDWESQGILSLSGVIAGPAAHRTGAGQKCRTAGLTRLPKPEPALKQEPWLAPVHMEAHSEIMVSCLSENRSSWTRFRKLALGMRGSEVPGSTPEPPLRQAGKLTGTMEGFQAGTQGTLLTGSEARKALLVDMEAGLLDSTHWEVLALREAACQLCPQGVIQPHCTWAGSVASIRLVYPAPRDSSP